MLSKKMIKVVSVVVASMGLMSVGASVSQAASFTAPKLGVAETMPTDPAIKKGDKIFVAVKDTKNQKVNVLDAQGHKTSQKVSMGSTYTAKDVKRLMARRSLRSTRVNG